MSENICYISGAITGVNNYYNKFLEAEEKLKNKGFIVVNPAKMNAVNNLEWSDYILCSLLMMRRCTHIYQIVDWENSKGCNIEYEFAKGINLIFVKESML